VVEVERERGCYLEPGLGSSVWGVRCFGLWSLSSCCHADTLCEAVGLEEKRKQQVLLFRR
jgi:hypothetical protein